MITHVLHFSLFVLAAPTVNTLARTLCSFREQLNQTLFAAGLKSTQDEDLPLMLCLAALHNFDSHHFSKSNALTGLDSRLGMFGLDASMLYLCGSVELAFEDDDLSDEVSCYFTIRGISSSFYSHHVAPEDFCPEISTDELPFSVNYDYVMCADDAVRIPSENSKRLYRILSGSEANYTRNLEYSRFSADLAYYDRNVYVNFFLERSIRLWKKLRKTLSGLTHRPIRLTVLLLIMCFVLILALKCLSSTLEHLYLDLGQKNKSGERHRSIST